MRSMALERLFTAFGIELRLLVVNWQYPLMHLLWGALFFQMFAGRDNRSAQALLETLLGRLATGLVSLVGLFIAGNSASRSRRLNFLDLEETFPTGFEVIVGRWLAGIVALMLFMAEPLLIAANQGPLESLLEELPIFLGETGLTIAFTTAMAWALLSRLKVDRWAYVILAAVWLGFAAGPTTFASRFPSASLLNFMRQGVSFYSDLWGRVVYGNQPFWFNLFYFGLLALCLAVMVLEVSVRRFRRLSWPGVLLMTGALLLSGLAGTRYIERVQAAQAITPIESVVAEPVYFTVNDYRLIIDISDPNQPRFFSNLTARNTGATALDQLVFRLNPDLSITNSNKAAERNGELVYVQLPEPLTAGESLSLTLDYEGILRVEKISNGVVEATDFIDPRGIRLTPVAQWYPVPAYTTRPSAQHDPAYFYLRVTNSDGLPITANLPTVGENTFEAEAVSWIFLIAAPHLIVEQTGDVTLVTSQSDLMIGRELVQDFSAPLQAITPFFPGADVHGLMLMVLGEEDGLPEHTPPVAGYPLVVIPRYMRDSFSKADDWQDFVIRALTADLWQMIGGELETNIGPVTGLDEAFYDVVDFMRLYYREKGDAMQMAVRLRERQAIIGSDLSGSRQALLEIYQRGGREAIVSVLRQMALHSDELRALSSDELANWIRKAGAEQ